MTTRTALLLILVSLLLLPSSLCAQDQGVTHDKIVVGVTQPLTGPAAGWGVSITGGMQAWADHVNEQGGVHGRKIELIVKDVAFLLGERYWPCAAAKMPRHDKPPVKAIVVACNTATAYGLEAVSAALKQWQLPVQVVGIVDAGAAGAVRAITAHNNKGVVAVLATVGTCKSEGYVRAIARRAHEAGMTPPKVIQQGCLGLAGSIEGDPSYISLTKAGQAVDYRGPAVGNQTAPIDPALFAQYDFEPRGLWGDIGLPSTWRLNSVDNYIRYHTTTLLERHRLSDNSGPISTVVLGCTHFPYYAETIAE